MSIMRVMHWQKLVHSFLLFSSHSLEKPRLRKKGSVELQASKARAARPGPGMYTSDVLNTTADHFICSQVVCNNLHRTQQHNVQYGAVITLTEAGHTYFLQNCSFCWFMRCLPRQCLHQDPILSSFVTEL